MRDFDPTQDHLLHPDGTTAQQGVTLPGAQEGALLPPGGRGGRKEQGGKKEGGKLGVLFRFLFRSVQKFGKYITF